MKPRMTVGTTHMTSQQHRSESCSNMLQKSNIILLSAIDSHFKKANGVIVGFVNIIKHVKTCDI